MNGVNLIPAARRAARLRGRQLGFWAAGAAAGAVLLGAAQAALWGSWRPTGEDPAAQIERLDKEIAQGEAQDRAAKGAMIEAKAAAQAAREVSDQPDWGELMTYIAGKLGPDAALASFRLEPAAAAGAPAAKAPAPKAPSPERGRYLLTLAGIARTQDAASGVAIELKRSELFQTVNLVETQRTVLNGSAAVSFKIECAITGAGGGE